MVDTVTNNATTRSTWRPDTTATGQTNNTNNTNPNNGGVVQTLGTGPNANPTAVTAANTRNIVNADPTTNQFRNRLELLCPPPPEAEPDEFPADGSLDEAKQFVEANPLQGNDPGAWTQDQREAFNVIAQDFGERHSPHHTQWHQENGPGGTQGPGSGEKFIQFHRDMMRQFTEETGLPVPSGWDPSTPAPEGFEDPAGTRVSSDPNVSLPGWLTADGSGTAEGNEDFGQTVTIDGKEYSNLNDFTSPDELGRAMGESGYHASVHSRMGGTMGGFGSPQDPTFYAWHGHIDGLVDQWLETDSGRAWAAANPDSPLLDNGGGHGGHGDHGAPPAEQEPPQRRGGGRMFAV